MSGRRQDRGFTLIELLVVIIIVVVLAAILFPVFIAARAKAQAAACLAYCRQGGLALQNYMSDYSDTIPAYLPNGTALWWDQLQPYMKSRRLWFCPSTEPATGMYGSDRRRWIAYDDLRKNYEGSYCINGWLYCDRWASVKIWKIPMKLSQVPHSSRTMAFSDGTWIDVWPQNAEGPDGWDNLRITIKRHNGGINMVFVGGNATWIARNQLTIPDPTKRRIDYNPHTGD